jgi:glutamate decarboxylase
MKNLVNNADYLADELEKMGIFTILSERGGRGVPLVAFKFSKEKLYDEVCIN